MSLGSKVLLVAPSASKALSQAIRNEGYHLTVTHTFESAKASLTSHPDLVVTELKLGDYNGLHLALRAEALGIPSIVIASDEFQHEVEELGAVWLSPDAAASENLVLAMKRLLRDPVTHADLPDTHHTETPFTAVDFSAMWDGAPGVTH